MEKEFFVALFLTLSINAFSQSILPDTTRSKATDTVAFTSFSTKKNIITIENYSKRFNPRKALLYSAILPGLGQVYNKKYWKLPFVYGGLIGLGVLVDFYNEKGNLYKDELFEMLNSGQKVSINYNIPENQLRLIIDRVRRERDFYIVMLSLMYFLQLIDAHVDAHLKEFELNPKLKVSITPSVQNSFYAGTTSGFSIKLHF